PPWGIVGAIILGGSTVLAAMMPEATKWVVHDTLVTPNNAALKKPSGPIRPSRPGELSVNAVTKVTAEQQRQEAVLADAQAAELKNQPHIGLQILDATPNPVVPLEERFHEQRERLVSQLARLDASPPSIDVYPGVKLEYDKGEVVIPLRIADDLA